MQQLTFAYEVNTRTKSYDVEYIGSETKAPDQYDLNRLTVDILPSELDFVASPSDRTKIIVGKAGTEEELAIINLETKRVSLDGSWELEIIRKVGEDKIAQFRMRNGELSLANFIRLARLLSERETTDSELKGMLEKFKVETYHFYETGRLDLEKLGDEPEVEAWAIAKRTAQMALLTMKRAKATSCMMDDPINKDGRKFKHYKDGEWYHPFLAYNNIAHTTKDAPHPHQWSLVLVSKLSPAQIDRKVHKEFPFVGRGWAYGNSVDTFYGVQGVLSLYRQLCNRIDRSRFSGSRFSGNVYLAMPEYKNQWLLPYVDYHQTGEEYSQFIADGKDFSLACFAEWAGEDGSEVIKCDHSSGLSEYEEGEKWCKIREDYIPANEAVYIDEIDGYVDSIFATYDRNGNAVLDGLEIYRWFRD